MMKRKFDGEIRQNPAYQDQKPKKYKGYFGDPKLIPRVQEYLAGNRRKKFVSIPVMAEDLQRMYGEYARKKKNAFCKLVEKAYDIVRQEKDDSEEELDDVSRLEAKHIQKTRSDSRKSGAVIEGEDDSYSSDNPDYVQYEESNSMNNMMSSMYKRTPHKWHSAPPSPAQHSIGQSQNRAPMMKYANPTSDTAAGFFLDRQGDPHSEKTSSSLVEETVVDLTTEAADREIPGGDRPRSESNSTQAVKEKLKGRSSKMKKKDKDKKSKEDKGVDVQKSSVTFADIGGNESNLKEICKLLVHMRHPEIYQQLGVIPPRGFLLHGPPGCGKTLLAHAIAGELDLPFIKLAATEIVSGVSGESEEKIRELFEKAVASAPCIMFIDEIDAITPKREVASKDMERRIVAQLLSCMDDLNMKLTSHVLVIGATNRPDSLDPALRRAGRFDREISLGIPDEASRFRILQVLCKNLKLCPNFDFLHLAKNTPGFVGADLMALTREAAMTAVNRVFNDLQAKSLSEDVIAIVSNPESIGSDVDSWTACQNGDTVFTSRKVRDESLRTEMKNSIVKKTNQTEKDELASVLSWLKEHPPLSESQLENLYIVMEDFEESLKHVQPSAKREGFATIPDVTWEDVGALHEVREELQLAILAPVHHAEQFRDLGLNRAQGILLAGPPGCGKTLLAKAIANESGINFISVKGPELLNMYVGESERAVRQVFQRARNSSPCVIFFDELDALCPRRSDSGEGGSSVRVVNQLLTEMDGLEERKQVFIMGATNRPDIIDPAILRPGRLDKTLYVGFPSNTDRWDILKTITRNGTKPKLCDDVNLEEVANDKRCQGFSGADLAALVREASVSALKEVIMSSNADHNCVTVVKKDHFEKAFLKVKPSVSAKDQAKYARMQTGGPNG